MSDFISKDELYHKLSDACNKGYLSWGANEVVKELIGECDSVEDKGEWIPDHTVFTKCSCCGWYMRTECFKPYRPKNYHFCPNCGASMKGSE